jgi:predicted AAA+ superfamily ATPase
MFLRRGVAHAWQAASRQFPVLLLTGPRQVGKTTVLQRLCGRDRRYVSLDDPAVRTLAQRDPALLLQRFEPPVLIDEIQYAPALLPIIKIIVDKARTPGLVWLTGSQQFQVMRGVSETLAGRVAILNLLGFSRRERHRLDLDLPPFLPTPAILAGRERSHASSQLKRVYRDIWTGAFPALAVGPVTDRDLFYSSYLQTYLQRDVRDLAQVGDQAAFLRFLRACAARTAQLLNLSDLARDADISVNTAKSWLSILEGSFQVMRVAPYHTNVTRRLVKAPKLYFLDTGLCAYLTDWTSPETLEAGAMSGAILETHVFGEILKSWWNRGQEPRIYYYRDRDGREVDFVLVKDRTLYPIEVKKSTQPTVAVARMFQSLDRLSVPRGHGAVICLTQQLMPLDKQATAVPVGFV